MNTDDASRRTRDNILRRLREAPQAEEVPPPDIAAWYARRAGEGPVIGTLAARFAEQARSWRAEVIETTPTSWLDALARVIDAKGYRRVLAGRDTPISNSLAAVLPAGRVVWYDENLGAFKSTLFADIDAAITTTRGGIAETGSLILWPSIEEPRTLSVVPPAHIAVLHASSLHETWFDAVASQRWAQRMPTNALLVTGPSKTADIQRLLVYGAHGPKDLVILLVHDAEAPA